MVGFIFNSQPEIFFDIMKFKEINFHMKKIKSGFLKAGFTLVETLIVIAIIAILSSIILVSLLGVRSKAKDTKRQVEVSQIGKLLMGACYLPDAGEGEYDLVTIANEIFIKHPEYKEYVTVIPKDPKTGTDAESKYIYIVNADGTKCALYANLENPDQTSTLSISVPTPGGGTGIFKATSNGWNGTPFYFQYSN